MLSGSKTSGSPLIAQTAGHAQRRTLQRVANTQQEDPAVKTAHSTTLVFGCVDSSRPDNIEVGVQGVETVTWNDSGDGCFFEEPGLRRDTSQAVVETM